MAGTYYDAVVDRQTCPIYNETPDKVKAWLKEHPEITTESGHLVYDGVSMRPVTIEAYLAE